MPSIRLTNTLLESAYRIGVFPMADPETDAIEFFEANPRAILPLDDRFHVSRRLARTVAQERLEIRIDTAFERVVRACAERETTWINGEIVRAYTALHRAGLAHSVEAWRDEELSGGLYGVALGGAFMGESMFTRTRDASKVCLVHLVRRLRERGYTLLDAQLPNPHLDRFGAELIPAERYRELLAEALRLPCRFA